MMGNRKKVAILAGLVLALNSVNVMAASNVSVYTDVDTTYDSRYVIGSIKAAGDTDYIRTPNGAQIFEKSIDYVFYKNGNYSFGAYGKGASDTDNIRIDYIDNTKPILDYSFNNSDIDKITLKAADSGSGVDRVETSDGSSNSTDGVVYNSKTMGDIKVYDRANNSISIGHTHKDIDGNGTYVSVTGVPTTWTNQSAKLLIGVQNKAKGINGVYVGTNDNVTLQNTTTSSIIKVSSQTISNNGKMYIIVKSSGNTYKDEININKIDKEIPKIKVEVDKGHVKYSVEDEGSGIRVIYLPNGKSPSIHVGDSDYDGSFDVNAVGTLEIIAEDQAGNITSKTFSVNNNAKKEKEQADNEWNKLVEKIPFVLPVGRINLADYISGSSNYVDVKSGLQTLHVNYKDYTYDVAVNGQDIRGYDTEFVDVSKKHWAYSTIKTATSNGYLAGIGNGYYSPKSTLTCADTFTSLDRVLIKNNVSKSKINRTQLAALMKNFNSSHWAYWSCASLISKIDYSVAETITRDGNSVYSAGVTRMDVAKILYQITKDLNIRQNGNSKYFKDVNAGESSTINYCVRAGLMAGDTANTFNPDKKLTRAELASIIDRLDKALKNK